MIPKSTRLHNETDRSCVKNWLKNRNVYMKFLSASVTNCLKSMNHKSDYTYLRAYLLKDPLL